MHILHKWRPCCGRCGGDASRPPSALREPLFRAARPSPRCPRSGRRHSAVCQVRARQLFCSLSSFVSVALCRAAVCELTQRVMMWRRAATAPATLTLARGARSFCRAPPTRGLGPRLHCGNGAPRDRTQSTGEFSCRAQWGSPFKSPKLNLWYGSHSVSLQIFKRKKI